MIVGNRRWRLRCCGGTYIIAQRRDVRQDELERICRYTPGLFHDALADPFSSRTLHDIWAGVDGGLAAGGPHLTPQELGARVLPELERRFRIGQLVLIRERPRRLGVGGPGGAEGASGAGGPGADGGPNRAGLNKNAPAAPSTPEKKPAEPKKTWIEIVLVDERKRPVPFEAYILTFPNGFEKSGSLDENGKAYVNGIDPGTCSVSFPYLHGEEWRPA